MRIHRIDSRVEIIGVFLEEDEYGGMKEVEKSLGKFWAEVIKTNFTNVHAYDTPLSKEGIMLRIRKNKIVKKGYRVIFQNEKYHIDEVDNTYKDSTKIFIERLEYGV